MRRMEMEINAEKLPLTCPILLAKAITDNKYKSPNHIKYLERNILQALAQGKARVIINMPPRHGKSELLSKYLPAWYLLNFPDNTHPVRICHCSHGFFKKHMVVLTRVIHRFYKDINTNKNNFVFLL